MACCGTKTPLLCTLMSLMILAPTQLGHTHGPHNGSPGGVPGRPPDPTIGQKKPKSALHQGCACTTSLLKCTNWPCMPLPPNGPPLEKKSTYGLNQSGCCLLEFKVTIRIYLTYLRILLTYWYIAYILTVYSRIFEQQRMLATYYSIFSKMCIPPPPPQWQSTVATTLDVVCWLTMCTLEISMNTNLLHIEKSKHFKWV